MFVNYLNLYNEPFQAIKEGRKTIEMRLLDKEKNYISLGELIEFTNKETGEKLLCFVDSVVYYDSFEQLYKHYNKISLGYKEDEVADPKDMELYYPKERQQGHMVIAIKIRLLTQKDHLYRRYQVAKIFENDIKLAIFDLDGTLIDSTSLWADIDTLFFTKRGMEVPPTYGKEIAHVGLLGAAKLTKEKYVPNENIEDIIQEWNDAALEAYKKHISLKENALGLLEKLHDDGVIIALATANSEELYLPCLMRLDIHKYFSLVMDVNSCKEGKDSPEIYDKISQRFGLSRNQVVVFEDMITAEKTAYEAGYYVIGVNDKSSVTHPEENQKYCHAFIENFYDVIAGTIDKIRG
ncbi:MAG: HAD hydrolase-like protein [Bacilli bacterium]|nr:HAD hydrolase-like protein [Bacilli bacterium]